MKLECLFITEKCLASYLLLVYLQLDKKNQSEDPLIASFSLLFHRGITSDNTAISTLDSGLITQDVRLAAYDHLSVVKSFKVIVLL